MDNQPSVQTQYEIDKNFEPSEQDKREFVRQVENLSDADLMARWRFESDELQLLIDASVDAGLVGAESIHWGRAKHQWRLNALDAMLQERKRMLQARVRLPQNDPRGKAPGVPPVPKTEPVAQPTPASALVTQPAAKTEPIAQPAPASAPNSAQTQTPISLYTEDELLDRQFPEPVWAVPGLLPTGLTILAGAPKIGKSWLALQIALAVATGGMTFNERVERGAVLYLALEDSPRRLQARIKQQKWPPHLRSDFMCLGNFESQIGDLRNGGGEKLSNCIEQGGYRFVVIDTLSRAVSGDQNDVFDMTRGLEPLHKMAHANNVALLLVDHHRKTMVENADAIADILGSTAKGAMADTALGLYRERGKKSAKLSVVGREVEEKTLAIAIDWVTGSWQLDGDAKEEESGLTERQREILDALADLGEANVNAISKAIGQYPGNTSRQLQELVASGLLVRNPKGKDVLFRLSVQEAQ